jgi:MATE family multidrug resistance protein
MFADVRKIAGLAWPVLIGQLAIIAFGVMDTAMVGRYSAVDLAALGLGSSIYISVYIGLTGILTALQPIAGQLYGARQYPEIGEQVRQSLWLAFALMIIGFLILYFPGPLLHLARVPAALYERTLAYLQILAFGLPAGLVFRVYGSLANAVGKPRLVMILQIGALLLKVPLNLWFIFGGLGVPALGGPGCALASTGINWTLAIVGMLLMSRIDVFKPFGIFSRFCWPEWHRQVAQLKLGIPMGLSYLIEVTSYTFMALFIARFGTTTLAGHQIAGNVGAVLYMTPLSIGIATSTLVAQALGAHRPEAARTLSRHGILMAVMIACSYGAIVLALRPLIIEGYTPNAQAARLDRGVLSRVRFAAGDHRLRTARLQGGGHPDCDLCGRAVGRRAGRRVSARLRHWRLNTCLAHGRTRVLVRQHGEPGYRRVRSFDLLAHGKPAASSYRRRGIAG